MLLKVAVSAAILGYLIYDAARGDVFANLVDEPKQWNMLAAAWGFCAVAVLLTFIRWWYLVRALGVSCRFRDALRISFWGYLFNLAPLGIVGGDLVKAVMLDHEHPHHRAKAIASVIVDRVIGLYVLFLVASTAILATGFWRTSADIYSVCMATFAVTVSATMGLAVVLGPDAPVRPMIRAIGRIPRIGRHLESLIRAVRMYNRQPKVLILASVMTVGVHGAFAIGCYLIACGLPGDHPTLAQHFVVMPLSAAMQVIPVPIGPTEFALDSLYASVPTTGAAIVKGQGLVVAIVYRLITITIAALGVFYYLSNRREMAEVIHEAENEPQDSAAAYLCEHSS
jgi:glycosyltransferase 2 family protein